MEHTFYIYPVEGSQRTRVVIPSLGFVIEKDSQEAAYGAFINKIKRLKLDVTRGRKRVIKPLGLRSRARHLSNFTAAIENKKDTWLTGSVAFNL